MSGRRFFSAASEAMNRYRIKEGSEAQFEQRWSGGGADSTDALAGLFGPKLKVLTML